MYCLDALLQRMMTALQLIPYVAMRVVQGICLPFGQCSSRCHLKTVALQQEHHRGRLRMFAKEDPFEMASYNVCICWILKHNVSQMRRNYNVANCIQLIL